MRCLCVPDLKTRRSKKDIALNRQMQLSSAVLGLLSSRSGDVVSSVKLIGVQYSSEFMGAHTISPRAEVCLLQDCVSIALLVADWLNNDVSVVDSSCN